MKLEWYDRRDRYMIGDWVLENGKPHMWTRDDYKRTKMGMEIITDMPLNDSLLDAMSPIGKQDPDGSWNIIESLVSGVMQYFSIHRNRTYKEYLDSPYWIGIDDSKLYVQGGIRFVHQIQHLVRDSGSEINANFPQIEQLYKQSKL